MIIASVKVVRTRDISHYAWVRIGQFRKVEHTVSVIDGLHSLNGKHRGNAKRQAEEIKFCIEQAKEYYDAALVVSLATRPVLLYYSAMSLALAEILLKQSGDSRLSILRANHNCHGLQLAVNANPKHDDSISDAAGKLLAKPQMDSIGNPRGTFEIWRRSSREHPVGGYLERRYPNGTTEKGYSILLYPSDDAPPFLSESGLSLFSCMVELPYMEEVLSTLGSSIQMIRATLRAKQVGRTGERTDTMIVHPNDLALLDKFGALVVADPAAVNTLDISEMPSGYIVTQKIGQEIPRIRQWPHSVCLTDEDVYFSCSKLNLGEFGFLYVALHICGNFARYYPDLWLRHIEKNSPLAMAINELCSNAVDRLPLLSLSELLRNYHVLAK